MTTGSWWGRLASTWSAHSSRTQPIIRTPRAKAETELEVASYPELQIDFQSGIGTLSINKLTLQMRKGRVGAILTRLRAPQAMLPLFLKLRLLRGPHSTADQESQRSSHRYLVAAATLTMLKHSRAEMKILKVLLIQEESSFSMLLWGDQSLWWGRDSLRMTMNTKAEGPQTIKKMKRRASSLRRTARVHFTLLKRTSLLQQTRSLATFTLS